MLISLKFQWFVWRCRQSLLYVVEESGFNLQRYLSLRYNNGWIWLSCVTGSLTDVVSTFILPPLSLKETQESAWSQRLEDRNLKSVLLHHFWTMEDAATMDELYSPAGERFPSFFTSFLRIFATPHWDNYWRHLATYRNFDINFSNLNIIFIHRPCFAFCCGLVTLFLHHKYGTILLYFVNN